MRIITLKKNLKRKYIMRPASPASHTDPVRSIQAAGTQRPGSENIATRRIVTAGDTS